MDEEAVRSRFKRVCVFCGSSTGKRECYKDAAIELGQELVLIFLYIPPKFVFSYVYVVFVVLPLRALS
jgi:hypothetical protein